MSAGARVKYEPECDGAGSCGARETSGLLADPVRLKEELMTEAACAEPPDELYADHVVKEELVLGPERPHRPDVGLTVRSWGRAAGKRLQSSPQKRTRGPQPEMKDCFVRLERLLVPTSNTRSSRSKTHHETCESLSANKPTLRPNINDNLKLCVKTKSKATGVLPAIEKSKRLNNTSLQQNVKTKSNASKMQLKGELGTKRQEIQTNLHKSEATESTKQTKKQKVDTSEKHPYICDTCGQICKFRHTLIQHLRSHLPYNSENLQIDSSVKKPYKCEICEKEFFWLDSYKRHLNIHAGKKRHTCDVCGKKFLESTCFKRHMLIHSKDKPEYPCDVCKKILTTSSSLKIHKRNVHLKLRLYSCDLCEKKYSTPDVLRKHRTSHFDDMPFICDICDKKFRNIDRLRFHKRIHTTQKPYSCDNCNRGFRAMYKLKKHKLLHLNGKPFSCKTCKKRFATSIELDDHKRNYKNPYECGICNKVFCESLYFKKHKNRTHVGHEKAFCEICRTDFKTTVELINHQQTHKGYSCGICQQNFADNIAMQKHKRTHNGKMRYSCDICDVKFAKWRDLFTHGKIHDDN